MLIWTGWGILVPVVFGLLGWVASFLGDVLGDPMAMADPLNRQRATAIGMLIAAPPWSI